MAQRQVTAATAQRNLFKQRNSYRYGAYVILTEFT